MSDEEVLLDRIDTYPCGCIYKFSLMENGVYIDRCQTHEEEIQAINAWLLNRGVIENE